MRVVISARGLRQVAAASQDEAAATCTGWKSYRPQPVPKNQCLLPQLQIVTFAIITLVHLPVCREQLGSYQMDFCRIRYWGHLLNPLS